jgi:nucleotide-binding universal stress UspA family protein
MIGCFSRQAAGARLGSTEEGGQCLSTGTKTACARPLRGAGLILLKAPPAHVQWCRSIRQTATSPTMYKRILIATDGSELADKGLAKGLELAKDLNAEVDIVTVSSRGPSACTTPWAGAGYMNSPEYKADREEGAQKVLQPALAKAAEQGITANPVHVLDRYAADGIIETAGERNSDLIVMTSHGRRGVTRVLLGSQTAEVLARSTLPVLVIR